MGWHKREPASDLVILGDGEGQIERIGGLLVGVIPDPRYPDNRRYELVQQNGESRFVAGSASINSQMGPGDVGKFVKLTFQGWAKGSRGQRFKDIEVLVWEGEPNADMKKWPRYGEFDGTPMPSEAPIEDDYGDDLPF